MKLYVGNLSYDLSENELREVFEKYGNVTSVTIIYDRHSKRSKGFGFVEMPDKDQAGRAIEALNGKELKGRPIKVDKALPKPEPRRGYLYR